MRLRIVRCLVLAYSLHLVLPPGWCCIFQPITSANESKADKTEAPACCGHCKKKAVQEEALNHDATRPAPKPVPFGECPCTERNTTSLETLKNVASDIVLLGTAFDFILSPAVVGAVSQAVLAIASDLSLQLLHCNWLC